MMQLVFTVEAKRDLYELRSYLSPVSPAGLAKVVDALEAKLTMLLSSPYAGRQTSHEEVLEVVETKYGFVIPYRIQDDFLFILRIYRSARKPLDYLSFDLPR